MRQTPTGASSLQLTGSISPRFGSRKTRDVYFKTNRETNDGLLGRPSFELTRRAGLRKVP